MPPAIRIENLGKRYQIGGREQRASYRTLRESLTTWTVAAVQRLRRPAALAQRQEFWALRGIDLEIGHGEVVGL